MRGVSPCIGLFWRSQEEERLSQNRERRTQWSLYFVTGDSSEGFAIINSHAPDTPKNEIPRTGDTANLTLWIGLLEISGTELTTILVMGKNSGGSTRISAREMPYFLSSRAMQRRLYSS